MDPRSAIAPPASANRRLRAGQIAFVSVLVMLVGCGNGPPDSSATGDQAKAAEAVGALQLQRAAAWSQRAPPAEPHAGEGSGADARATADAVSASSSRAHAAVDADQDPRCLARTGHGAGARESRIHRWVDTRGIVHYADRPPVEASAGEHRVITTRSPAPIELEVEALDTRLPPRFRDRVIADAYAIAKLMRQHLDLPTDSGLRLTMVFVGTPAGFAEAIGAPQFADRAGVYRSDTRTLYVRRQPNDEDSFLVLRHEIVHALLHEWVGRLPAVLNEGMAEYLEHVEPAGFGARVDVGRFAARLQRFPPATPPLDSLLRLLEHDGQSFYIGDQAERYTRSLGLVSTLMSDADGRAVLSQVLLAQRQQSCEPIDSAVELELRYPGGLARLAQDWERQHRQPDSGIRDY